MRFFKRAVAFVLAVSLMAVTLSGCGNRRKQEEEDALAKYAEEVAKYKPLDEWKQELAVKPSSSEAQVQVLIGLKDAMASYIKDPLSVLLNGLKQETVAFDGNITYVGLDDKLNSELELLDIIQRASGKDIELNVTSNSVSVDVKQREWPQTGNSNYDDWVAKSAKNLNTFVLQLVIVMPTNMTQVGGEVKGVSVSNNVLMIDLMQVEAGQLLQFSSLMGWYINVEYGGTQKAWTSLGLQVPDHAKQKNVNGVDMMVTECEVKGDTLDATLSLKDMFGDAAAFLPSEQWLSGSMKRVDGNIVIDLKKTLNNDIQGMPANDLLWFSDEIYLNVNVQMPYRITQSYGVTAGVKVNGSEMDIDLNAMADNIEYQMVSSLNEVEQHIKTSVSFPDVDKNAWYADAVIACGNAGIISGNESGYFDPNGQITTADAITVIMKALDVELEMNGEYWAAPALNEAVNRGMLLLNEGEQINQALGQSVMSRESAIYAIFVASGKPSLSKEELTAENILPDGVTVSEKYKSGVISAYAAGIVAGSDSEGTMRPETPVTRAQFCKMLYNSGLV